MIPEDLRAEYRQKYRDKYDSKIKLPLWASYQLLKALGSDLARRFFNHYEGKIRPLLNVRNNSILAHGFAPIDERSFRKLLDSVLEVSETKEEDIPEFPLLKL